MQAFQIEEGINLVTNLIQICTRVHHQLCCAAHTPTFSEVAPFGITITLIEPGYFRTDFLDDRSVHFAIHSIPDYIAHSSAVQTTLQSKNHNQPGDPARLAGVIVELAGHPHPPLRFAAGTDAVGAVADNLDVMRAELERWQDLSRTIDLIPADA